MVEFEGYIYDEAVPERERDVDRRLQGSPGQFMNYNPMSFAGEWSVFSLQSVGP